MNRSGKPPVRGAREKLKVLTNPNKRTPVSQPHSSLPMVYMPYKDQHISAYLSSAKSKKLSTDLSSKRRTNQTAFDRSRDDEEIENDNNHQEKEQHEDLDKQISQLKNEIREIEQEVQGNNSVRNEDEAIRETLRENNTSHVDSKRKSREQSQPSHPSSLKQSLQIKKDSHRPKQTIESTRSHKSNKQNPLDPIYKDLYFDTPRIEKTEESTVPGYSQPKQEQQSKFRESGYFFFQKNRR